MIVSELVERLKETPQDAVVEIYDENQEFISLNNIYVVVDDYLSVAVSNQEEHEK